MKEVVITENELPGEVVQAIKAGRKVVAIKLLTENTGIGMANAKVLVDRASAKLAPRPPRQTYMKDYNPGRARLIGMVLALAVLYLFYRYYTGA
ncbi:MAG: hypothetical protein U5K76_04040 [Woeseiaceae bacterium]|nr:hypothetical protein [Woeseiaceae bacterium]